MRFGGVLLVECSLKSHQYLKENFEDTFSLLKCEKFTASLLSLLESSTQLHHFLAEDIDQQATDVLLEETQLVLPHPLPRTHIVLLLHCPVDLLQLPFLLE